MQKGSKLPKFIRKEILKAADELELIAEYALTEKDYDKTLKQFLALTDTITAKYSIEAGTYIMLYIWRLTGPYRDFISNTYSKIIYTAEWKRFVAKAGNFILHGEPPGFDELCEIYDKRHPYKETV